MSENINILFIVFVHRRIYHASMIEERNFETEVVFANRESMRIFSFVDNMVKQGKMTQEEAHLISQEEVAITERAGIFGSIDKNLSQPSAEEKAAVQRHANHCKKGKIIELHPELEAALTEAIEFRRQYPMPEMTPLLSRPGEALAQYMKFLMFIEDKRDSGEIEHSQAHEIFRPSIEFFEDNGIDDSKLSNATDKVAIVQGTKIMEDKLLELCPHLADQVRELKSGRGGQGWSK